jgi:hypothetical protein
VRSADGEFQPAVFAPGKYTINIGKDTPHEIELKHVESRETANAAGMLGVRMKR